MKDVVNRPIRVHSQELVLNEKDFYSSLKCLRECYQCVFEVLITFLETWQRLLKKLLRSQIFFRSRWIFRTLLNILVCVFCNNQMFERVQNTSLRTLKNKENKDEETLHRFLMPCNNALEQTLHCGCFQISAHVAHVFTLCIQEG